jgi:UDP-N-acetyl-D-mannosaminuronate dehydrogenase
VINHWIFRQCPEEIIKPIPERSGLRCGEDFKVAYSPERLNPNFLRKNLVKPSDIPLRSSQIIVSGMDEGTTGIVGKLYARITAVYAAKIIRTVEAAKVTPNLQRNFLRKNLVKPSDIPLRSSQIIARVNELSIIFEKMGLNTGDVLDAASTKWNFHRYSPGLVGGHSHPC